MVIRSQKSVLPVGMYSRTFTRVLCTAIGIHKHLRRFRTGAICEELEHVTPKTRLFLKRYHASVIMVLKKYFRFPVGFLHSHK